MLIFLSDLINDKNKYNGYLSKMKFFVRSIAFGSIFQQILSIAIFVMLTQTLGTKGYGIVAMAFSLVLSIYNFSGFWVAPYIVRFGAKQKMEFGLIGDVLVKGGGIIFS